MVTGQIVTQVLAYVLLGGWLLVAILRPNWRPTTPLIGPAILVSAAYAISALVSQRPRLRDVQGLGLDYSLGSLPFVLAPLVAWLRRIREEARR